MTRAQDSRTDEKKMERAMFNAGLRIVAFILPILFLLLTVFNGIRILG
jgi:fumarate reductase subunit D